ncbi:hypothetical protein HYU13_00010 [Candidatus Woesearchaeota archaeon]|nr:hypothetical protein [Candidatus Woesearchaeota archaeon]
MKSSRNLGIIFGLLLIGLLAASGIAEAACTSNCGSFSGGGVTVTKLTVEANDVDLSTSSSEPKELTKTDEIDVLVIFRLNKTVEDVQVRAELTGYDKSDKDKVSDETDSFDVVAGNVYDKRLTLELPVRLDQGSYALKVRLETKEETFTQTFPIFIDGKEHLLEIRDIVLSPESEVKAGRALLASVRVKNRGENQEEDVKVKVSIPALGISASDFIDELDEEDCTDADCDDSTTSEELYLRIPDCAEPGEYTLRAAVEFDDGDEESVQTAKVVVTEGDLCQAGGAGKAPSQDAGSKTIIAVGPESQDVAAGGSASYPLTLTNNGAGSRSFTIEVDAPFSDVSVSPSKVLIVGAGESKAAFITLAPKPGVSGTQQFTVSVSSGDQVLKQVPLKVTVLGKAASSAVGKIKKALEVGLIVLVVLVVILGLIIGFNKLKGNDGEGKGEQSYY